MTYDLAPEEPTPPPPDSDIPLPGERRRKREKIEIEDDLECVHCGYNLRGLTKKHRCPECGTPAGFSVEGDLLQYAPVPWLKTLKNGLAMMLWAIAIDIASVVNLELFTGFGVLLNLLSAGLAIGGAMLLTTPEPKMVPREAGFDVRRAIRLLAALNFACSLTIIFSPSANLKSIMVKISLLLSIALLLTLAVFLRRFAARIPECDLERSTTQVIWGFAISLGVFVFFGVFSLTFAGFRSIVGPAPCIAMVGLFSAGIFACWLMILLYRFYGTIKWAAYDARMQFEPPPAPKLDTERATEDWTDARG